MDVVRLEVHEILVRVQGRRGGGGSPVPAVINVTTSFFLKSFT